MNLSTRMARAKVARILALLSLAACGAGPEAQRTPGDLPTEPVTTPPVTTPGTLPFDPASRDVPTLRVEDIQAHVDALSWRCEAGTARFDVEAFGLVDGLEIDLVKANMVSTIVADARPVPAEAAWKPFSGSAPCEAVEGATLVLRAFRGGEQVDCAVSGSMPLKADVLAGAHDEVLLEADRPSASDCHDIAQLP